MNLIWINSYVDLRIQKISRLGNNLYLNAIYKIEMGNSEYNSR